MTACCDEKLSDKGHIRAHILKDMGVPMVGHELCLKEDTRICSMELLSPPFLFPSSVTINMGKGQTGDLCTIILGFHKHGRSVIP